MIKLILFDLDDTLYRELDFVYGAFKEVAHYLKNVTQLDEIILYKEMLILLKEQGRGKIFNEICNRHKIEVDVKQLIKVYRSAKPKLCLYEDAEEILRWGRKEQYKLGIITDGASQVQHNKIECLNLKDKVDYIIATYDLGEVFSKPHQKAYVEMLNKFQVMPQEAIYVGDNPHKDFIGAKKLGVHTIRIIRPDGDHMNTQLSKEYEAEYNVSSLEEIKSLIRQGCF